MNMIEKKMSKVQKEVKIEEELASEENDVQRRVLASRIEDEFSQIESKNVVKPVEKKSWWMQLIEFLGN